MENNALINEIITAFLTPVSVTRSFNMGRVTLNLMSNQAIMYQLDHRDIDWFYSKADIREKSIPALPESSPVIHPKKKISIILRSLMKKMICS